VPFTTILHRGKIILLKKILSIILLFVTLSAAAKPITVTLPFPPGGATDRAWRTLMPLLNKELPGYEFVTDYRPGGGGAVAAEHVISQTDTHLFFTSASVAISAANPSATHKADDFQMLGYFGSLPMIFVVSPDSPDTMSQFVKHCKTRNLNMGTAGVGSTVHLVAETIMKSLNCPVTPIFYKGPGLALTDLASSRIDFMADYASSSTANLAQDGKIKNIMVIGNSRLSDFPNVPTSKELGINTNSIKNWQVLLVNTRANQTDVYNIQRAVNKISNTPEYISHFRAMGLEGAGENVGANFLRDNFEMYRKFVKPQ
jgi:tripartite-type tricarboxylate transporter receptor subunit TctC